MDQWCNFAKESKNPELIRFAQKLKRHSEGILNHCIYPIHTGKLEGINNTLKVIKRKAYGFLDTRYFALKAKRRPVWDRLLLVFDSTKLEMNQI